SYRRYDISSDQIFREMLAPGGDHHKHVVEGGVWWRHAEMHKARARGDEETAARLQAEADEALAALANSGRRVRPRSCWKIRKVSGRETICLIPLPAVVPTANRSVGHGSFRPHALSQRPGTAASAAMASMGAGSEFSEVGLSPPSV